MFLKDTQNKSNFAGFTYLSGLPFIPKVLYYPPNKVTLPSTSWLLSNLYVVIFLLQNICGIIWKRTAGLLEIDLLWPQDSSKESWSAMVDYSYNFNIHKPEARGLEPVHGPAWATEGDRVSETNQTKISDKRNKANSPFPSINQIALTFPYTWVLRIAPCCSPKLFASS